MNGNLYTSPAVAPRRLHVHDFPILPTSLLLARPPLKVALTTFL